MPAAPYPTAAPPLWLGETPDAVMLAAIADMADGWNSTPATIAELRARLARVDAACVSAGRPLADLELSLEIQILIAPTRARVEEQLDYAVSLPAPAGSGVSYADPASRADLYARSLIGTPDEVVARIEEYRALGISHFMLWFMDFPRMDGIRLFAETVLPQFATLSDHDVTASNEREDD